MPSPLLDSASSNDTSAVKVNDERTPLLTAVAPTPIADAGEQATQDDNDDDGALLKDDDAPLPRTQIFLLCYTRVVEPIAFFSIFPYINSMIEKTGGVDPEDVGFYSGLIESLFSATQMCVMILWGKVC